MPAAIAVAAAPLVQKTSAPGGSSQYSYLWTEASKAALSTALADRVGHGLDLVRSFEMDEAASDEAFSAMALRYAQALASGLVNPTVVHDPFTLGRAEPNLASALETALATGTLGKWLAELPPQDAEYAKLSASYRNLQAIAGGEVLAKIPDGVINVGDSDTRIPAIVDRLVAGGYLIAAGHRNSVIYSPPIADAIKAMQRDYGITEDGVIGPDTLGILNMSVADHARAIAVALERRRWLDRSPPATRIDVNTAAAALYYYRNGQLIDTRKVIVGSPGTETPPLQSPIYRLVANPTWTVPKSIQNGELANVGVNYLERNNMELRNGWIVQRSGPDNALGLVKFDMMNAHAIYLHDTSSPELFDRSQRYRSHGCVRVEDALGFAQLLADDQGLSLEWQNAQSAGEEQFVPLKTYIPVRLIYWNVFIEAGGKLAFRTDPYGWNEAIAKELGFGDRAVAPRRFEKADISP
nr:L,D-transpeptidase family protein [Sphingobium sp. BS19]